MITLAIIVAAVLIAAVLIVAAMKPDTFQIQRSVGIAAPADRIFPLINDLRSQVAWTPFDKDPAMKREFSAATAGPGAIYHWDGNRQVGKGSIAITEAAPPSKVTLKLDMLKPFEAHNIVEFTLVPNGADTIVTWAMQGRQPFMGKLMSTFVNCDKMVGREFETGLANLKAIAER